MRSARMLVHVVGVAMLLGAVPATASITPAAQAVLDRFVDASGGRSAWQGSRVGHSTGSLSVSGLHGTVEMWRRAPDQRASVAALGQFTIRDWVSGTRAWRTDPSGRLGALDGKDLEESITSTWFENQRWLEPDQGGGDVALGPAVTDSLGTFAVLEVRPPAGNPRQLEFDTRSGLLVRVVSRHDQLTVVTTDSDFRKVGGWMVPFHSVQQVGGPGGNTVTLQLDAVDFPAGIPDARFSPPADSAGAPAVAWMKSTGTARLPFDYRARHVWLRASVNGGPPADFILDTGASLSVIDSAYAARIGLASVGRMQAQGGAASGGASFATLDSLRLGAPGDDGVALGGVKVVVVNLNSSLAPFFWRDCAGIVGGNVIAQFVTRIDYDGRRLTFFDPRTFTPAAGGTALPMTLTGGVPVVNIQVDGAYAGGARVDVGSDATLDLHTPFVRRNGLLARSRHSIGITGAGIGGTFESRLARLKSIEIGPYRIADPLVGLSTTETGALASEDYAGNIGNGLLDRFTLTLDYGRRQIWLEPGAHLDQRRNYSRLGAQFAKYGDELRAVQVTPGSPAAAAGLKPGDAIAEIDGRPIASLDRDELERRFEEGAPGTKVTLVVLRDGRRTTLGARLKDML